VPRLAPGCTRACCVKEATVAAWRCRLYFWKHRIRHRLIRLLRNGASRMNHHSTRSALERQHLVRYAEAVVPNLKSRLPRCCTALHPAGARRPTYEALCLRCSHGWATVATKETRRPRSCLPPPRSLLAAELRPSIKQKPRVASFVFANSTYIGVDTFKRPASL
jgi:hypothetical protein